MCRLRYYNFLLRAFLFALCPRHACAASSFQRRCTSFFCCVILSFLVVPAAPIYAETVTITPEERAFLSGIGPITVCPDPDWKPFEYLDSEDTLVGIARDFLDLLEERLDITFDYVIPQNWEEALALSRAGDVMILPFLNATPEREEWLVFTEPLLVDPSVIITREEHPYITDMSILRDKTIALPTGTSIEESIRRDFPHLTIITAPSESDVLHAIVQRQADMTVRSLHMAAYTIRSEGFFTLKIAGYAPQDYVNHLRMGVHHSVAPLRDILNKGIASITSQEREEIINRHVNITVVTPVDYTYIWRIAGILVIFIAFSLYVNMHLKKINSALRTSERSKSILLANLPGIAYRCQYDAAWTMSFVSDGCQALTGYASADLIHNRRITFNDLIHPDDRAWVAHHWEKAVEKREQTTLEYRIITADKQIKWVYEKGVPLFNENNEVRELEGLIIDITDRKVLEQKLNFTAAFHALIARISAELINAHTTNIDAILSSTLEQCGAFLGVDRVFLLHFSPDEHRIKTAHEWHASDAPPLTHEAHNSPVEIFPWIARVMPMREEVYIPNVPEMSDKYAAEKHALLQENIYSTFCMALTKDERLLGYWGVDTVARTFTLSYEQRELLHILGTIIADALTQIRLEEDMIHVQNQVIAANKAKSEFVAHMSHEIRTPLNGVIGIADLLNDTPLNEEQQAYVDVLHTSGETLLSLVNDILDLSKIEAGKIELEAIDFSTSTVLDDSIAYLAPRAHEKGVECIFIIDPDVPEYVCGDPKRLSQVVTNLVNNAIKFTAHGEVSLRISVEKETQDTIDLRFTVRDTGIGIPAEKIDSLFTTFTQGDASTTREFGGSGLGLAISKQLTEMMNGAIGVESAAGEGASFWFTTRLKKRPPHVREDTRTRAVLHGVRVMIVDDNATNTSMLATRLTAWGMRPTMLTCAADVTTVVRKADEENDPFRVALIDACMPDIDGEEIARLIAHDGFAHPPRMILMTWLTGKDVVQRTHNHLFTAVVSKPIRLYDLRNCLVYAVSDTSPVTMSPHIGSRERISALCPSFTEKHVRVLVVEDTPTSQHVVHNMLKKMGIEAEIASQGKEAIEKLCAVSYDLVLMDCQMPVMDGYEATRIIREADSHVLNHDIPIIAMTAHATHGDRDKCLAAGMNDYLAKPITLHTLSTVIARWL